MQLHENFELMRTSKFSVIEICVKSEGVRQKQHPCSVPPNEASSSSDKKDVDSTERLDLKDTYAFEAEATVLEILTLPCESVAVLLNRTVFHPQGGGQPSDTGKIIVDASGAEFEVHKVMCAGPPGHPGALKVLHLVSPDARAGGLPAGAAVRLRVDAAKRRQHARLHSAGHLLDAAVAAVGLDLRPLKGYHFPDGPYVEYAGAVPAERRAALPAALDAALARLVAAGGAVDVREWTPAEARAAGLDLDPALLTGGDVVVRAVAMGGRACPCEGTHVRDVGELAAAAGGGGSAVRVTKIKSKKGNTRVSYTVEE